jgi:hypothetical protein
MNKDKEHNFYWCMVDTHHDKCIHCEKEKDEEKKSN